MVFSNTARFPGGGKLSQWQSRRCHSSTIMTLCATPPPPLFGRTGPSGESPPLLLLVVTPPLQLRFSSVAEARLSLGSVGGPPLILPSLIGYPFSRSL